MINQNINILYIATFFKFVLALKVIKLLCKGNN